MIPSNIHVSQNAHVEDLPSQRDDNHGAVVMQSETLETFFDSQRRYDGNRRAHHAVVVEVVGDSEDEADSSGDNLFGSDGSDETAHAEAQGNTEIRGPHKAKLGCKANKEEVKERKSDVKPPMNFYERLGLQRDATEQEYVETGRSLSGQDEMLTINRIKTAARKMKIAVHPHRLITENTSKEDAKRINQKASEVGEAAACLLDWFARRNYDEELQRREWDNSR
ncbi:hypothetical protein MMC17_005482 [Xylographa soralifera]|nr:hypothetical protein [Xylographa soralifera]